MEAQAEDIVDEACSHNADNTVSGVTPVVNMDAISDTATSNIAGVVTTDTLSNVGVAEVADVSAIAVATDSHSDICTIAATDTESVPVVTSSVSGDEGIVTTDSISHNVHSCSGLARKLRMGSGQIRRKYNKVLACFFLR